MCMVVGSMQSFFEVCFNTSLVYMHSVASFVCMSSDGGNVRDE